MGLLGIIVSRSTPKWVIGTPLMRTMSTVNTEMKKKPEKSLDKKQILMRLRRKTGFPIMKCKQALLKSNYDLNLALESIKADAIKEGWERMEMNKGKVASQGLVTAFRDENRATLVEINCESDFVAKTSEFQSLVATVARTVLHQCSGESVKNVELTSEEMLKFLIPDKNQQVQDALASTVGKLKEKIVISRGLVINVEPDDKEIIGIYTHPDMGTPRKGGKLPLMGRYAALVAMRSTALEPQGPMWLLSKGRDIAQHVVGMNPKSIGTPLESAEDNATVTEDNTMSDNVEEAENKDPDFEEEETEREYEMYTPQQLIEDSDELLKQPFLLDANITVQNWLDIYQLKVLDFVRYEVGELQNLEESDA